jgi:hypothetical protein
VKVQNWTIEANEEGSYFGCTLQTSCCLWPCIKRFRIIFIGLVGELCHLSVFTITEERPNNTGRSICASSGIRTRDPRPCPEQRAYKNSVPTAKKTQHFTITKISWSTLFKEIIAVYSENHTKHTNTLRAK